MDWLPNIENLKILVPLIAIIMSIITFGLYVFRSRSDKSIAEQLERVAPKAANGQGFAPGNIGDVATFAKALGELGGVLAKLSPSVVALVASVLFLAIAALSTGALQGGHQEGAPKDTKASAATGAGAADTPK